MKLSAPYAFVCAICKATLLTDDLQDYPVNPKPYQASTHTPRGWHLFTRDGVTSHCCEKCEPPRYGSAYA